MDHTGSAEYKALIHLTPTLQLVVKTQLTWLGAELVASGLITPDSYIWLISPMHPEDYRAAYLIRLIQHEVQQNPRRYQTFIDVFKKDQSRYSSIIESLQRTVEMFRQQQSVTVGATPPTNTPFSSSSQFHCSESNQLHGPPRQSNTSQSPLQHSFSEQPRQHNVFTKQLGNTLQSQPLDIHQTHQQPRHYCRQYQQPEIQPDSGHKSRYHGQHQQHHDGVYRNTQHQQSHNYQQPRHHQQPHLHQLVSHYNQQPQCYQQHHDKQLLENHEHSWHRGHLPGFQQQYQQQQQVEYLQQYRQPQCESYRQLHHQQQGHVQQQHTYHQAENSRQYQHQQQTQDQCPTYPQQRQHAQYASQHTQPRSFQEISQQSDYQLARSEYRPHQPPESHRQSSYHLKEKYQEHQQLGYYQQHLERNQPTTTNSCTSSINSLGAQQWQPEHRQTGHCPDQQGPSTCKPYPQQSGVKRSSHWVKPPQKFHKTDYESQQIPQSIHPTLCMIQNEGYPPPFGYNVSDRSQVVRKSSSDHPLLKHRPKLASFYSHQPEVPEDAWPPVKKTQYINLALIRTEHAVDFGKEYLRETIRGSIDDIMKDKDDVKYNEVFADISEGARLLFEGRPGCGKTTMMNKVSQDWDKRNIPALSSSLLFLVHLRRFGSRPDVELEDIIRSTAMDFTDEEINDICACINKDGGKRVVFALDGLDEYCPKKRKETYIHQLIQGQRLSNSIVIVASRPAASQKYRRNATKCIEVLGFLKPQINEYIESYFSGNDGCIQGLKTYLRDHPNVMHMCYLPLHVAMITYLYQVEGTSLPQTETEIYRHFTLFTLLRSIRKRNEPHLQEPPRELTIESFEELCPEDKVIFDLIIELAYQATVVKPQQVFSADDVKELISKQTSDTGNDESTLGLIVLDRCFVKFGLKEIFTFLHLTFQEFLAACYIARCGVAKQESIIANYGRDIKLHVVWKFFCGMTQFLDEKTMNIFKLIYSQTSNNLHRILCAHESQQECVCTYVVQSLSENIELNRRTLNPADCTALAYVILNSTTPTDKLALTSCTIGPEGYTAIVKEAHDKHLTVKTLSLQGTKIRKGVEESLCAFLEKCASIVSLDISKCDIQKQVLEKVAACAPVLSSLETFDVSSNKLGVKSGDDVLTLLQKLPKLKHIRLCWFDGYPEKLVNELIFKRRSIIQNINGESEQFKKALTFSVNDSDTSSARIVAHGLQNWINQQTLKLRDIDFCVAGAQALAEGLQYCSDLQTIVLDGNDIGDAGAQALAQGLKNCTNLRELDLNSNNIGDAGAQALAGCLHLCTNLQTLDLHSNNISDAGAQALAGCLHLCINLQTLNLYSNNISVAGGQALAGCLHLCTNLQTLYLDKRSIGGAGFWGVSGYFQFCTNLQTLDLSSNNICAAGAQALAGCLHLCTSLQTLNLHSNSIGDAGAQALAGCLQLCTNLQTLHLHNNSIDAAGAQALAGCLHFCTSLQTLNLHSNNIGDAGAQALAGCLQLCTNLQTLGLHSNNIGEGGAQALAGCFQLCTNLQTLDLQRNSLTDSSVDSLSHLIRTAKQLKQLKLWGNKFTNGGERALRAAAEERDSNPDFVKLQLSFLL